MNKVVTINLNGSAYQLEELGYETLRAYLDGAAQKLAGNPDKDEIIADIEQAIGDKCRATLNAYKTVVLAKEISQIVSEMGSVDDGTPESSEKSPGSDASAKPGSTGSTPSQGRPKRLYRIREGAMIGGVCNGIAAYFEVDPTIVRLVFALAAILTYGTGFLAYIVMMIVVPYATTQEDKAEAYGDPMTAQEFIRRAKEGYYEGMKSFGDKHARREWQRKFKRDMREWGRSFKGRVHDHAERWSDEWPNHWRRARPTVAAAILLPIFGLIGGVATVLMIIALVSIIATGTVLGTALPIGMHAWLAVLLLLIAYNIVLLPLRIAKGLLYYGTWTSHHYASTILGPIHTLVWLGLIAFGVWYANRHIPEVHEFFSQAPAMAHSAVHSIKDWWSRQ